MEPLTPPDWRTLRTPLNLPLEMDSARSFYRQEHARVGRDLEDDVAFGTLANWPADPAYGLPFTFDVPLVRIHTKDVIGRFGIKPDKTEYRRWMEEQKLRLCPRAIALALGVEYEDQPDNELLLVMSRPFRVYRQRGDRAETLASVESFPNGTKRTMTRRALAWGDDELVTYGFNQLGDNSYLVYARIP